MCAKTHFSPLIIKLIHAYYRKFGKHRKVHRWKQKLPIIPLARIVI